MEGTSVGALETDGAKDGLLEGVDDGWLLGDTEGAEEILGESEGIADAMIQSKVSIRSDE